MKQENDALRKLPVKDFSKKVICDGHLFLLIGNKKFYLMKPGFYVDPSFIKKHAATNPVFDFESVVNQEIKDKFKIFFRELRFLQFEKDLRLKSYEITNYFHQVFTSTEHFLSFALACHEEFCQLPSTEQIKIHEADVNLFKKSLYSSAFSIISGMANDFYHYLMLRDLYNLTFCLDIGLCESNYSYFISEACNKENQNPGSGINYLNSERASEIEKALYLNHPSKSYNYLKSLSLLAYPELAEVLLYQHELSDGSGFPRGVRKSQVSSWEAIVIFSDSLVEILPDYTFETDVINFLIAFHNKKLQHQPIQRVHKKLCLVFEEFKKMKEVVS
jgi:hypothetical protein